MEMYSLNVGLEFTLFSMKLIIIIIIIIIGLYSIIR